MGPCAKRRVRCTIVTMDGRAVTGENECESPREVCPREPGEGYTKCQTICRQIGHAEQVALDKAYAKALPMAGAIALIAGHERVCDTCMAALTGAGVTEIRLGAPWI